MNDLTFPIGAAVVALCLLGWRSSVALQHRQCGGGVSVSALMFLYYGLAYGLGAMYFSVTKQADVRYEPGSRFLEEATLLGLVAVCGQYFALVLGRVSVGLRRSRELSVATPISPELSALLVAVGYSARVGQIATGRFFHRRDFLESSNLGVLLAVASALPLVVLGARAYGDRLRLGRLSRLTIALALMEVTSAIPRGGREDVLAPLIALVLVALLARQGRRVFSRRLLATLAVGLLLIFPVIADFRGDQTVALSESITSRVSSALGNTLSKSPDALVRSGVESVLNRFSDPVLAAKGLEVGISRAWPAQSSTETLGWAITSWMPRFMMPSKSDPGAFGHKYGRSVGVVQAADNFTSVSVGHPLELYVAGGWVGVFFGALAIGLLVQMLDRSFRKRFDDALWVGLFSVWGWSVARSPATILSAGFVTSLRGLMATALFAVGLRALLKQQQSPDRRRLGASQIQPNAEPRSVSAS